MIEKLRIFGNKMDKSHLGKAYALHNCIKHAGSIHTTIGAMYVHSSKYAFWKTPFGENFISEIKFFLKIRIKKLHSKKYITWEIT